MDYKAYNLFSKEDFEKLTKDIKVAQCMRTEPVAPLTVEEVQRHTLRQLEDLTVSNTLFCSYCNIKFTDRLQQRLHYKLDWHRYNLKQKLTGLKPVSEDKFLQVADDVSSISGSESESGDDDTDGKNTAKSASNDSSGIILEQTKRKKNESLQAARHSKVFFENCDGKIISLYRCVLHGRKDVEEKDEQLVKLALGSAVSSTWAVIMLGGGHFAAGVFEGSEVLAHKTFHCYTVRARQGGSQSSRDQRSAGSHPKCAGASLRRYNEASLTQHVQDIFELWEPYLKKCGIIFVRAVSHNRNVLFGGKKPPLDKNDPRLRTIPFPTRRATFSEVKRIHNVLATVEVYGSACDFQSCFPQSPKKDTKAQLSLENPKSNTTPLAQADKESEEIVGCKPKPVVPGISVLEEQLGVEDQVSDEKRRKQKPVMDRAKERKSPNRPLPSVVMDLARSSSESEIGVTGGADTVPQCMKDQRKESKKNGKKKKKPKCKAEELSEPVVLLRKKLLAACNLGDTALLANCLTESVSNSPSVSDSGNIAASEDACGPSVMEVGSPVTNEELIKCLNEKNEDSGNTYLHIAAEGGHLEIVRELMKAGADPCLKNKKSLTPYVLSANKDTRNVFRKFMAEFPDKYNYAKSQITSPLTDEMEKKLTERQRESKKAKREKDKVKRKEADVRRAEESEKDRFLRLSDREKRALAAERRMISQASNQGKVKLVVSRCFECAKDMSGQVPFEYNTNRFCTMDCLKIHRFKDKNNK